MGKRKRATKPPPKKKAAKLDKVFDCPFCGHEQTVDCFLEREINLGRVECRVCGVKYSTTIHHLDEEIDVYAKWIDACESATRRKEGLSAPSSAPSRSKPNDSVKPRSARPVDVNDIDDDDDDDDDRRRRPSAPHHDDDDDDVVEAEVTIKPDDDIEAVVEAEVENDSDDDDDDE